MAGGVGRSDVVAPQRAGLIDAEIWIHAGIRAAIVDQRLPPGTKLTEDVLASLYGSSRAHIRRVLLSLSHERLVDLLPSRGAFVATVTPAEAHDVFAARLLLETAVLRTLQEPAPDWLVQGLAEITAGEHRARRRHDRPAMIRLSAQFHVALAAGLGNAVIAEMLEGLVARSSVIIAMYESVAGGCCLAGDHDQLVSAVELGSGDIAARMMKQHLQSIEAGLLMESPQARGVDIRAVLGQASPHPSGGPQ